MGEDRMTLPELRVLAAIHSGRVEVRPATTMLDTQTFVLRGRGMVLALLATGGTVDRLMALAWSEQIRLWDHRAADAGQKEPGKPYKPLDFHTIIPHCSFAAAIVPGQNGKTPRCISS